MIPKQLRWMAVGAGVSYLSKRKAERSVDKATEMLEDRLPAPLARVADALPPEVVRAGGAVVAASSAARTAAVAAKTGARATGTAVSFSRTAGGALRQAADTAVDARRSVVERLGNASEELREQADLDRRQLTSDYLRYSEGDGPALEALLDARDDHPLDGLHLDELPETPDPVAAGRRRYRPGLPAAPVNRVRRTYNRPTKPWDR